MKKYNPCSQVTYDLVRDPKPTHNSTGTFNAVGVPRWAMWRLWGKHTWQGSLLQPMGNTGLMAAPLPVRASPPQGSIVIDIRLEFLLQSKFLPSGQGTAEGRVLGVTPRSSDSLMCSNLSLYNIFTVSMVGAVSCGVATGHLKYS